MFIFLWRKKLTLFSVFYGSNSNRNQEGETSKWVFVLFHYPSLFFWSLELLKLWLIKQASFSSWFQFSLRRLIGNPGLDKGMNHDWLSSSTIQRLDQQDELSNSRIAWRLTPWSYGWIEAELIIRNRVYCFRTPPAGGAVSVSEGIGNPVYDEDRPLEGVRCLHTTWKLAENKICCCSDIVHVHQPFLVYIS